MDSRDKWRAENLRIDPSLVGVARPAKPKRRRVYGFFLRGPVPMTWLDEAGRLPGKSPLLLGIKLWHLCGRNYNKLTFSISNLAAAEAGLSRYAKYRALAALERAGPIEVHRSGKRSISVTLLCAAGETPEAILNRRMQHGEESG
jgi:hypothetical protein